MLHGGEELHGGEKLYGGEKLCGEEKLNGGKMLLKMYKLHDGGMRGRSGESAFFLQP